MYKTDAVKFFGTQAKLVRALKGSKTPRSKGAVSMWGDLVPLLVAHELAAISGGKLKIRLRAYQRAADEAAERAATHKENRAAA